MAKFTIEVRDRATIDIKATVEVEAETYQDAIKRLETEDQWDLEFETDRGLGWWDRHGDPEYRDVTSEDC